MRMSVMLLVAAAALSGCAPKEGARPGGAAPGYPPAQYMTATGIGQSEGEARNQAVAELSRIFESRVRSETTDRAKLLARGSGEETFEQRIDSQIRVVSSVELKGVEIERHWEEDGNHYALAVLDRGTARDNWLRDLEGLDKKIEGRLEAAGQSESRLVRLRALQSAVSLWVEREAVASRLRVLGHRAGEAAGYDMKGVFGDISKTKAGMPIYVRFEGRYGGAAEEKISEALGRAGFVLAENRSRADVTVEGRVEVREVDLKNPELKYARASLWLSVTDVEADVSVGDVTEEKRGAHLSFDEAANTALKNVIPAAAEKLVGLLEEEGEGP